MPKPQKQRTRVFVAYSHADKQRLEDLQVHFAPLIRLGIVDLWDDTKIKPGDVWRKAIDVALDTAKFAVLLVSKNFLASEFIATVELPKLLAAARSGGAKVYPVILTPCVLKGSGLGRFQAVNPRSRPLNGMSTVKRDEVFVKLTETILEDLEAASDTQDEERDLLECALAACRDLGLYKKVSDAMSPDFAGRLCVELIEKVGESCDIEPPYKNKQLQRFRGLLRECLKAKGHVNFRIYLQRLCDKDHTWRHFCSYHADHLRRASGS